MINLEKRAIARRLIRQLAEGTITNDDFEDGYPRGREDPALGGIYQQLWYLWSDLYTHALTEGHRPKDDAIELMQRCATFLGTDLEYKWPRIGIDSLKLIFCRILGFSKPIEEAHQRELERLSRVGNLDVWPFVDERDWSSARRLGR